MLDQQVLRNEYKSIAKKLKPRGYEFDISYFEDLESRRKSIQSDTEVARNRRNQLSKEIGAVKSSGEDVSDLMVNVANVGTELSEFEEKFALIQDEIHAFQSNIPNIAHDSVPVGSSEEDNEEVRKVEKSESLISSLKITLLWVKDWECLILSWPQNLQGRDLS